MGTDIVRVDHLRPRVNLRHIFAARQLRMIARDGLTTAFEGFERISRRLGGAIRKARGLSIEIDRGVRLSPLSLIAILEHATRVAGSLREDIKAIEVELDPTRRKVTVKPRTWSGEEQWRAEHARQEAYIAAQLKIDAHLPKAKSKIEAEQVIAQVLFRYFGIRGFKAYDVAPDGSVRISHAFTPTEAGTAKKVEHTELSASHFFNWVLPEDYMNEAMGKILVGDQSYVLVRDPMSDPLCVKTNPDGSEIRFESKPFALVGEKIAGKVSRVYKVDWKDDRALLSRSGPAIQGVLHHLAEYKQRAAYEIEIGFLDRVSQIAAQEKDLDSALAGISDEIAIFFRDNGKGSAAESITIMLYDVLAHVLISRVKKDGILETFQNGLDDPTIGARIFNDGKTVYLRRASDWKGLHVSWGRKGEGALVGTVVKGKEGNKLGVIVVSSRIADAFTQEQVHVLEEVSRRVGPSFDRIIEHMVQLNLDQNFGNLESEARIFNKKYLELRLAGDINLHHKTRLPLSVIYCDIDYFKDVNEALGHESANLVLREILLRMHNALRDGELYRHGGEEIVVRVNIDKETAALVGERIRRAVDAPLTVKVNFNNRMAAVRTMAEIERQKEKWKNIGIVEMHIEEARQGTYNLVITLHKTISVGIAEFKEGDTPTLLVDRADLATRTAKSRGKNQVVVSE